MSDDARWTFRTTLWLWDGDAAWHFVTVPEDVSDEVDFLTNGMRAGFGSVRVEVVVGGSTWRTSLFPDSKRGAYVLPMKKAVRKAEGLAVGDEVEVAIRIVER